MAPETTTKRLFFGSNLIYTIAGVILLGIGIWICHDSKSFIKSTEFGLRFLEDEAVKNDRTVIDYIEKLTKETYLFDALIIIGASILIIALIGWLGALTLCKSLIVAYSLLTCLMIVIQIEIIGYIMIENSKGSLLPLKFKVILKDSIEKHYHITNSSISEENDKKNAMTMLWDVIMETKHCCGVDNYKDFNHSIPIACCKNNNPCLQSTFHRILTTTPTTEDSYMFVGCFDKFTDLVYDYFVWIGKGFIAMLGLQIINIFLIISITKS